MLCVEKCVDLCVQVLVCAGTHVYTAQRPEDNFRSHPPFELVPLTGLELGIEGRVIDQGPPVSVDPALGLEAHLSTPDLIYLYLQNGGVWLWGSSQSSCLCTGPPLQPPF